jgi:glycosyltransferase involved in cell wall biosynthesis
MRLAVEITACTPSRTGVGYYAEHLVDALIETRRAGDEVILLSNQQPAPELSIRWASRVRIRGPLVRVAWMQAEAPRLLAETRADVAVFPNYVVPLASPCPTVVIVHDLAILRSPQHFTLRKRLFHRAMLRPSVAAASVVGTVSEASQKDIVALLGVPRERTAVFPAAAHPSCRPATQEEVTAVRTRHGLRRPYLLTVGTLEPRKNLPTLLRAFDRLGPALHDHDLVIVGARGWLDRQLVQQIQRRAGSGRVHWLGYVPVSELAALYTGADLFVLASTWEGFGLPVLEAMACGAPVIASDIPALREVGGGAARFVPPNDAGLLAQAILQALSAPGALADARAAGRARAAEFSWERAAEAVWARARQAAPARVSHAIGRANGDPKAPAPLPAPVHPPPSGLGAPEWALLATVVYADTFDSPLPLEQAVASSFGVALDEAKVRQLAKSPALKSGLTLHPGGYLVLTGREALVDAMPEREATTRALLDRCRGTLSWIARLPFVRSIVISGGLAHNNPGERPDVDLFVVSAKGRAYTTYTLLVLATKLTGNRRLICPNYLVDESELPIAYHRDLFTAHQLRTARPFSGGATYAKLCDANRDWVSRFFPAFGPLTAADATPVPSVAQRLGERALGSSALESLLRMAWRVRLRRLSAASPRADMVLGDGILKLHVSDYRSRVLDRLSARLESLRAELGNGALPLPRGIGSVVS